MHSGYLKKWDGDSPIADLCEWWPEQNKPAELHSSDPHDSRKRNDTHVGCQNPAEVIVGADGLWRLCKSCAALPHFKRFRSRKEIRS